MRLEGRVEAASEEVQVFVFSFGIIFFSFSSSSFEEEGDRCSGFGGAQGKRHAVRMPRKAQDCPVERPRDCLHRHQIRSRKATKCAQSAPFFFFLLFDEEKN